MHIAIGGWLEGQICEKIWQNANSCGLWMVGVWVFTVQFYKLHWRFGGKIIKILGSKKATRWQNLNSWHLQGKIGNMESHRSPKYQNPGIWKSPKPIVIGPRLASTRLKCVCIYVTSIFAGFGTQRGPAVRKMKMSEGSLMNGKGR